ncbi:MAG: L,D-transpeptidase/peptidoglycan binding protein [Clostridium sp.]|nr:L,D-transpeptidase/peptidoglycan binding protein [Clostridium sp.]
MMEETEDKRQGRKRRWLLFSGILLLCMLAGAYIGASFYFRDHYYLGTMIDGVDCGCMKQEDVERTLQDGLLQRVYTISGRGGVIETITAEELEACYTFHEDLEAIGQRQKGYLWFQFLWKENEYHLEKDLHYDQEKLFELIDTLSCFDGQNVTSPEDAYISEYLPEVKGYEIVSEVLGTTLLEEAREAIAQAVLEQRYYIDLEEEALYQKPRKIAEDAIMNEFVERLNHYTKTVITYRFGEETEILDGDRIHEWLMIRGREIRIDEKKVAAYISELADAHNTYYNRKRFITTGGEEKELPGGYGFLMDEEAETKALLEFLETGGHFLRTPVYLRSGANYSDNNIGGDYVEIDLSAQHLYLYIEGECILETDIVSGCMNSGNGTPQGIYDLEYKRRDTVLRGPTWESYVNYWMPFYGSVGMHDATWRNRFGGEIYRNSGSHGCVNLPYEAAEEIYRHVYAGMPVVCYY